MAAAQRDPVITHYRTLLVYGLIGLVILPPTRRYISALRCAPAGTVVVLPASG